MAVQFQNDDFCLDAGNMSQKQFMDYFVKAFEADNDVAFQQTTTQFMECATTCRQGRLKRLLTQRNAFSKSKSPEKIQRRAHAPFKSPTTKVQKYIRGKRANDKEYDAVARLRQKNKDLMALSR